jgi:hypothetical protein
VSDESELERALARRTQELRVVSRRLEWLERLREGLGQDVSELMRGPLSALHGQAQVLERGHLGPLNPKMAHGATAILRQAGRLRDLLGEMQERLRDDEQVDPLREPTDVSALVADVVAEQRPAAALGGVRLALALPPGEAFLDVDPLQLRMVLTALLDNAVRSAPAGSEVSCALEMPAGPDGGAAFLVADAGPGIPAEQLPTLFDRYRGGSLQPERGRGGAHALWWCREVLRRHGATLGWEPAQPRGSRFGVQFPSATADAEARPRTGRARVLLHAADPALCEQVARALLERVAVQEVQDADAAVAAAGDGVDALVVALPADEPAAGLELLRRVGGRAAFRGVPLVIHTALAERGLRAVLEPFPRHAIVAPPATSRSLLRAVQSVLAGRRGPPLSVASWQERLRRCLSGGGPATMPVSILRIALGSGAPASAIKTVAAWLEPRTRSADVVCEVEPGVVLLQLPGAPEPVAERIARALLCDDGAGPAILGQGADLRWVSWDGSGRGPKPAELLARLAQAPSLGALDAVAVRTG